jgi:hypothetical protein
MTRDVTLFLSITTIDSGSAHPKRPRLEEYVAEMNRFFLLVCADEGSNGSIVLGLILKSDTIRGYLGRRLRWRRDRERNLAGHSRRWR